MWLGLCLMPKYLMSKNLSHLASHFWRYYILTFLACLFLLNSKGSLYSVLIWTSCEQMHSLVHVDLNLGSSFPFPHITVRPNINYCLHGSKMYHGCKSMCLITSTDILPLANFSGQARKLFRHSQITTFIVILTISYSLDWWSRALILWIYCSDY